MANPKASHRAAVKHIGRYLLGTKDKVIKVNPDPNKLVDCYVDASFCGEWIKELREQAKYIQILHALALASSLHTPEYLSHGQAKCNLPLLCHQPNLRW